MSATRKAPPGGKRRSLENGHQQPANASSKIAGLEKNVDGELLPHLDAAVVQVAHFYDGRRSLGELYLLRSGKWVAGRGRELLGYFQTARGALNRIRGRAEHEPPPESRRLL